jgi:hypothetical protein
MKHGVPFEAFRFMAGEELDGALAFEQILGQGDGLAKVAGVWIEAEDLQAFVLVVNNVGVFGALEFGGEPVFEPFLDFACGVRSVGRASSSLERDLVQCPFR